MTGDDQRTVARYVRSAQGSLQTVGAVSADAIMAQITQARSEMNTSVLAALGVLTAKVAARWKSTRHNIRQRRGH